MSNSLPNYDLDLDAEAQAKVIVTPSSKSRLIGKIVGVRGLSIVREVGTVIDVEVLETGIEIAKVRVGPNPHEIQWYTASELMVVR